MPGLPLPLWYYERHVAGGATLAVEGGATARVGVRQAGGATLGVSGGAGLPHIVIAVTGGATLGLAAGAATPGIIVSLTGGATLGLEGGGVVAWFFEPTLFEPFTVDTPPHIAVVLMPDGRVAIVEIFDHVAMAVTPDRRLAAMMPARVARVEMPERELLLPARRADADTPEHEAEATTHGGSDADVADRRSTIS